MTYSAPWMLLIALLWGLAACGGDAPVLVDGEPEGEPLVPQNKVLGVCFMDSDPCGMTYVDLGVYDDPKEATAKNDMVPVYVFPSIPPDAGGRPNPLDPNHAYRPYRLQNNVFAGPGYIWSMWEVRSANLVLKAEPQPGVTLWGIGVDPSEYEGGGDDEKPSRRVRDLYLNPFMGEAEILTLAQRGDVTLVDLRVAVDCPVRQAQPGDLVVNLNPQVPLCAHE